MKCPAQFADEVLDGPDRAYECAEELAEQHHCRHKRDSHHHLKGRHAARQAVVGKISRKGLETAERAVFLRVGGVFRRNQACHENDQGNQYSPLEKVLRPILYYG